MVEIILKVETDTYQGEYRATPAVQVAFEREWKVGLPKAFGDQQKLEYLYWLGWKASHQAGEVVKPFDQWLETVRSVEMVEASDPLS